MILERHWDILCIKIASVSHSQLDGTVSCINLGIWIQIDVINYETINCISVDLLLTLLRHRLILTISFDQDINVHIFMIING